MISFSCRKMWGGKVSVRSCIIDFAKRTGQVVEVEHGGQKMRINSSSLYTCDNVPHRARMTDKYIKKDAVYYLYDYEWKPIIENDEWTGDGKLAMLEAWKKLKAEKQLNILDKEIEKE